MLVFLVLLLAGCPEDKDKHADIPGTDKAIKIEHRVLRLASDTLVDYRIVNKSDALPSSLKDYFGEFGTLGWETTSYWNANLDVAGRISDTEMRERAEGNLLRNKPSSWLLVIAVNLRSLDDGTPVWGSLGRTYSLNGLPGTSQLHNYSYIFKTAIAGSNEYTRFGGRIYDWVVAHELGHSIAGLRHPSSNPEDHAQGTESYNGCAMWEDPPDDPNDPDNVMGSPNLKYILERKSFCASTEDDSTCARFLRDRIF